MPAADRHRPRLIARTIATVLPLLLGAKLWLIWMAANPTPFWDQWDAEAAGLYKPWLEGTWDWPMFVRPHNEHRILPTRLIHLALFELLGRRWNPPLQMLLNALLHLAALAMLARLLASALPATHRRSVWLFTALLHAVPFGWDSTLQGFNTHFYALLLLTFGLLWICTAATRTSLGPTLAATASAGVLVLTMASGLLGALAAAVVLTARRHACRDRTTPRGLAIVLAGIAVGGLLITPNIPGHQALRAPAVAEFLVGLGRVPCSPPPRLMTSGSS